MTNVVYRKGLKHLNSIESRLEKKKKLGTSQEQSIEEIMDEDGYIKHASVLCKNIRYDKHLKYVQEKAYDVFKEKK